MALADWDVYTNTGETVIALEVSAPLDGAGSFHYLKAGVTSPNRVGGVRRNVVGERYKRSGALQSIWKSQAGLEPGVDSFMAGVLFLLQNDADFSVPGPDLYLAGYHTMGNSGAGAWGLYRFMSGLNSAPTTVYEGPSTPAIVIDTPFALDVEWRQDSDELSGVRVILKVGSALDYSDLTEVFDVTESSATALMGESFGEGFGVGRNLYTGEIDILWDKIRGYDVDPLF